MYTKNVGGAGIRFYLHKEFRAAEIEFYLHKEFRVAGRRFYLHKDCVEERSWKKHEIFEKLSARCARQFGKDIVKKIMKNQ